MRSQMRGSVVGGSESELEPRILDRSFLHELLSGAVEGEGRLDVSQALLNLGVVCEPCGAGPSHR